MKQPILITLTFLFAISLHASTSAPWVIYGEDNRIDTFESKSSLHKRLAESTAAMVSKRSLTARGQTVELHGIQLSQYTPQGLSQPVCEKEKFSQQPLASVCSGFLVADDIIATAGHCITSLKDCQDYRWVFNYKVEDENQTSVSVDVNDVYSCTGIIQQSLTSDTDFALIKLDRPLKGKALKIAKADPAIGTSLVMIGHPSGLPQKISDGAKITSLLSKGFMTDLDAFQGNSGSAVFNGRTGEVVGILVNGNQDYRHNSELNCSEVNIMPSHRAGEGVSSFRQFISALQ